MRKSVWFSQLERALSREGMTCAEKRTVLNYYEEMYQDRSDDGAAEEDIIKEFGFPEDIAKNVRENDERTSQSDSRIPSGTQVFPDFDVEVQGYRGADTYNMPGSGGNTNAAANSAPSKESGGSAAVTAAFLPLTIVGAFAGLILMIVFFAVAAAIPVAGLAVVVGSFFMISTSAGAWLIAFGVGIILFAVGCLLFLLAVMFAKVYWRFLVRGFGGNRK